MKTRQIPSLCVFLTCVWLGADIHAGLLDGFGLNSKVVQAEKSYTCSPEKKDIPSSKTQNCMNFFQGNWSKCQNF